MNLLLANDATYWATKIFDTLESFLIPILIVLCGVGLIWAVVVGVKMIKAEDKNARDENKARLINIAITIVAVIALIAVFYALKAWIGKPDNGLVNDAENWITSVGSMLRK